MIRSIVLAATAGTALILHSGDRQAATQAEDRPAQAVNPASHAAGGPSGLDYYLAALAAAEKSLRLDEMSDARRWLDAAPENWRGWEWSYLQSQLDVAIRTAPMTSESSTSAAVSANGRWLAVADAQGRIELRSTGNLQVVREIGDHTQAVYSIVFSPDSRRIASVSRDATSRVWDVETGKEVSRIRLDNPGVAATTFSPDGRTVATCTWMMEREPRAVHGVVWIWETTTGKVAQRELVGNKPLDSIAWSRDGETLVVGSWDGCVHVLDRAAAEQRRLTVPDEGLYTAVVAVDLNHDASLVAAGSKDQTVRIWNLATGELVRTLRGHQGHVNELAFSRDGKTVATAGEDSIVRLWDLEQVRAEPQKLRGHRRSVVSLAWLPEGRQLVTIARDQQIKMWDTQQPNGRRLAFQADAQGTYSAVFSPDGKRIYVATHTGRVVTWDAENGKQLNSFMSHPGSTCNFLAIDDSGKRLLTCSWDQTAKLWSLPDHRLLHTLNAEHGVYHCSLSRAGRLAALSTGNVAQLWDAATGSKLGELTGHQGVVRQVAFNVGGSRVATASDDKTIGIWDTQTLELVQSLSGHQVGVSAVEFAADGKQLVTADRGGQVRVWSMPEGALLQRIQASDRMVFRLSFSPDGGRIAAATHGVVIIDPAISQPLLRLYPVSDSVWFTMFSADGQHLVASNTAGQVAVCSAVAPRRK